jgi:class 3 adenylate cyclase
VVALDLVRFREHVEALDSAGFVAEQTKFLRYLRGRFDAADGRFIKFFGDGCFAAFDSPPAALHFVHEAAQDVGSAGYHLRVGFHIGQVELVDNELVGTTVVITHELMRNAEPGSALISRSASDVLRSYGVDAEDGPVLSLASVRGSWQTYTLPVTYGPPR